VNGKIGLRFTRGGFGSPFFSRDPGQEEQIRVDGSNLVVQRAGAALAEPVTSLAAAAAFVGVELTSDPGVGHDMPGLGDVDAQLDTGAAAALAAWIGFSASVLEQVRAKLRHRGPTSRVQLWPEHFDMAFDHGVEGGMRANFGCSPGDAEHPEPYVYVGPFEREVVTGSFWNASFGAVLGFGDLLRAADQRASAMAFLRDGAARLSP
jgi:hypothetical protein